MAARRQGVATSRFVAPISVLVALSGSVFGQTYVVTNTGDSGPNSLREGMATVNAGAANAIHFSIPGGPPYVITPATPLPSVMLPVSIDGSTQPGYVYGQTMITIVGSNITTQALWVSGPGSTVKGLHVRASSGIGIYAALSNVVDCVVGSNTQQGIVLIGSAVRGCRIGTDLSGLIAAPNGIGVLALGIGAGAQIGGSSPSTRNLISGNANSGVIVASGSVTIQGNWIGTDALGSGDLANAGAGIVIASDADSVLVGGTGPNDGNLFAHNDYGVVVYEDTAGHQVLGNLFFDCLKAIRLEPGGNDDHPAPGIALVRGTEAIGLAGIGDRVELFLNGMDGSCREAVEYLGSATADSSGAWSVGGLSLGPSDSVMATATSTASGTSEFSPCLRVGRCAVITTANSGLGSLRAAVDEVNAPGCTYVEFHVPGPAPHEIVLASELPPISPTDVVFDATTQEDYVPDVEMVAVKGTGTGLHFLPGARDPEVRGLRFRSFSVGVRLEAVNGAILADNVFQTLTGALLEFGQQNVLVGNKFGTDVSGQQGVGPTGIQQHYGVRLIGADLNQVGSPGQGNVFGAAVIGVRLELADDNVIRGNHIGIDIDGNDVIPNIAGITLWGDRNIVGGGESGAGNLIAGNWFYAVAVSGGLNRVVGNTCGLDQSGSFVLGNGSYGGDPSIEINGSDNEIGGSGPGEGNIIAAGFGPVLSPLQAAGPNGPFGAARPRILLAPPPTMGPIVKIGNGNRNRISRTEIWSRGQVAPPIRDDSLNPYPAPTGLVATTSSVSGQALPGDLIEVFRSDGDAFCQNAFEFLGSTVADGSTGAWTLGVSLGQGDEVLATAKALTSNTSEFSTCSAPVP